MLQTMIFACVTVCCVMVLAIVEKAHGCPKDCYCDRLFRVTCNSVPLSEEALKNMQLPPKTTSVRLTNNGVKRLSRTLLRQFVNLSALEISKNPIHFIPDDLFVGFSNLRKLKLKRNKIRILRSTSFNGLADLDYLSLEGNLITTLPNGVFRRLLSIRTLLLSANLMNEVPNSVFTDHQKLKNLYLSNNNITTIRDKAFRNLHLKKLGLSFNRIAHLPAEAFEGFDVVFKIFLLYNPLECDCVRLMTYFHYFAALKNKVLGHCVAPPALQNKNILTAYKHTQCSLCDISWCRNGGVCAGNFTSMTCACPGRYSGSFCEHDVCDRVVNDMKNEEILRRLQFNSDAATILGDTSIDWNKATRYDGDVVAIQQIPDNVRRETRHRVVSLKLQDLKDTNDDTKDVSRQTLNSPINDGDPADTKQDKVTMKMKMNESNSRRGHEEEQRQTIVILYLTCATEFLIILCLVMVLVWRKCDDWKIERKYNANTFTHARYKTYFAESYYTGSLEPSDDSHRIGTSTRCNSFTKRLIVNSNSNDSVIHNER